MHTCPLKENICDVHILWPIGILGLEVHIARHGKQTPSPTNMADTVYEESVFTNVAIHFCKVGITCALSVTVKPDESD